MSSAPHPLAAHHLPPFITPPGATDVMMVVALVLLLAIIFLIGLVYLRLHALPERIAHRGHKIQFEIVAILALLALFTHNHLFWIAGLLLALIQIPDFSTPLATMAEAQERIARRLAPVTQPAAAREGTVADLGAVADGAESEPTEARVAPAPEPAAPHPRTAPRLASATEPEERSAVVRQEARV